MRYGLYKAHFWTWTNGMDELRKVRRDISNGALIGGSF